MTLKFPEELNLISRLNNRTTSLAIRKKGFKTPMTYYFTCTKIVIIPTTKLTKIDVVEDMEKSQLSYTIQLNH